MKKIEILIITYNHQDVIARALDSILEQSEFGLQDIVVCDDCSSDDNWQVISNYKQRYPQFIKAYRNEKNLGIYGNMNRLVELHGSADLYYILAGDDALCPGLFEQLQCVTKETKMDGVAASFYCDWVQIGPDGSQKVYFNNMAGKGFDHRSLALRALISSRSVFFTKTVIDKFLPVDITHGVAYAEGMFDLYPHTLANKFYYFPFVGTIYYSGIGFSTNFEKMIEYRKSELYKCQQILTWPDLPKKDQFHVKSILYVDLMYEKESFWYYFPAFWCFLRGIVPAYGYKFMPVIKDWYGVAKMFFKYKKIKRNR